MCKKCGIINPNHREAQCKNPPDPNIATKLAKHKKLCNELRKQIVRERIHKSSSGAAASGPQHLPNHNTEHVAHMAAAQAADPHD